MCESPSDFTDQSHCEFCQPIGMILDLNLFQLLLSVIMYLE